VPAAGAAVEAEPAVGEEAGVGEAAVAAEPGGWAV